MNNKGISLVTVVVIIIVMIIIATISIVAGNKLIVETKNLQELQNIETIRQAIDRVYQEYTNSGIYTPKGEGLIGRYSPAIAAGDVQAVGWYLLDEDALKELGVNELRGKYLVNYEYSQVLDMSDPTYYEKYCVVEFIYKQRELKDAAEREGRLSTFFYPGEALDNIEGDSDTGLMYKTKYSKYTEVYGTGWYLVDSSLINDTEEIVNGTYLINYDNAKYVEYNEASYEKIEK